VKNVIFGKDVVVEWSFEAVHKGPFAGTAATGTGVNLPGCGVYQFDPVKRQVTTARIYFDVTTLHKTNFITPASSAAEPSDLVVRRTGVSKVRERVRIRPFALSHQSHRWDSSYLSAVRFRGLSSTSVGDRQ